MNKWKKIELWKKKNLIVWYVSFNLAFPNSSSIFFTVTILITKQPRKF